MVSYWQFPDRCVKMEDLTDEELADLVAKYGGPPKVTLDGPILIGTTLDMMWAVNDEKWRRERKRQREARKAQEDMLL